MDQNSIKEIIFLVENDPEGGYIAKAIGESILLKPIACKNCEN